MEFISELTLKIIGPAFFPSHAFLSCMKISFPWSSYLLTFPNKILKFLVWRECYKTIFETMSSMFGNIHPHVIFGDWDSNTWNYLSLFLCGRITLIQCLVGQPDMTACILLLFLNLYNYFGINIQTIWLKTLHFFYINLNKILPQFRWNLILCQLLFSFLCSFLGILIYFILGHIKITFHNKYCRKKMSSLDKDRHDLQSTIEALQEGNQTTLFSFCILIHIDFNVSFKVATFTYIWPAD